jgi:hypothetical protein
MSKMIRISDETHTELVKISGELQSKNGRSKTLDDAIKELIRCWKQAKKH